LPIFFYATPSAGAPPPQHPYPKTHILINPKINTKVKIKNTLVSTQTAITIYLPMPFATFLRWNVMQAKVPQLPL